MIAERKNHYRSRQQMRKGKLFLNRIPVGEVVLCGNDGSWTFGEFTPFPEFSDFAPLFGAWSLLMHAEDAPERLSDAASEELRRAEYAIDTLRATVLLDSPEERRHLRQVNIDGRMIEWKE